MIGMRTTLSSNVHNAHFAPCKGHSRSKDLFHKGDEHPLTHRIPHTMRSQGHHNLVCFPLQITGSGTQLLLRHLASHLYVTTTKTMRMRGSVEGFSSCKKKAGFFMCNIVIVVFELHLFEYYISITDAIFT